MGEQIFGRCPISEIRERGGVIYAPLSKLEQKGLRANSHETLCIWKGKARWYDLTLLASSWRNVGWQYDRPKPDFADLKDYISFDPSQVSTSEAWYLYGFSLNHGLRKWVNQIEG